MAYLISGLAVLVIGLLATRAFARANPAHLSRRLTVSGGVVSMLAAGVLRRRGLELIAERKLSCREVMQAFNNAEAVKKVKVLGNEWLPDSDELTPTSKLKRRGIHARYATEIEALYA